MITQLLCIRRLKSTCRLILSLWLLFPLYLCAAEIELLVPQIISVIPHDRTAFTQGLAIDKGDLYESTGLYGNSSLRQIDLRTGTIVRQVNLPAHIFAEGIAIIGSRLFQITWKEQKVFIYNLHTLQLENTLVYQGEGWGLCKDGHSLWMSNGTERLIMREAKHFQEIRSSRVAFNHQPILYLNDLECVDNDLYVNVWKKDVIVRFDKTSGQITAIIDAADLLTASERQLAGSEGVLNGIAYHPQRQTFFITGKYWPWLFEVRFIPKK